MCLVVSERDSLQSHPSDSYSLANVSGNIFLTIFNSKMVYSVNCAPGASWIRDPTASEEFTSCLKANFNSFLAKFCSIYSRKAAVFINQTERNYLWTILKFISLYLRDRHFKEFAWWSRLILKSSKNRAQTNTYYPNKMSVRALQY